MYKGDNPRRYDKVYPSPNMINRSLLPGKLPKRFNGVTLFEDGAVLELTAAGGSMKPVKHDRQPSLTKSIKSWLTSTTKRG